MKYFLYVILLFSLVTHIVAQDVFGLEELKLKSNDFTEYVMNEGKTLNEKIPINLVPNRITDFKLVGQDSLAMVRIKGEFIEYYDSFLAIKTNRELLPKILLLYL